MNLEKYQNIILDCDGVILDSNSIKEKNIFEASKRFTNANIASNFSKYFVSNNGAPRMEKISSYFKDSDLAYKILGFYNNLNEESLKKASLSECAKSFLEYTKDKPIYVVSGGDELELHDVLKSKKIFHYFKGVCGAPKTKIENIQCLNLEGQSLFIGDSKLDYEVAKYYGFDFVFMSQYTQFKEWREFFEEKDKLLIIKNFCELF